MFVNHTEKHEVLHAWNPELVKSLYGVKPCGGNKPQLVHLDSQRYASSQSAKKGIENKVVLSLFDCAVERHVEKQLLIFNAGGSCGAYFKGEIEDGELKIELGAGAATQLRVFEKDFKLPQGKISVVIDAASAAALIRATAELGDKVDILAGVEAELTEKMRSGIVETVIAAKKTFDNKLEATVSAFMKAYDEFLASNSSMLETHENLFKEQSAILARMQKYYHAMRNTLDGLTKPKEQ